jgi:putative membrane protein
VSVFNWAYFPRNLFFYAVLHPNVQQIRHRVLELTGALTVISIAIVAVVIAGAVPSTLFPRAPGPVMDLIPHFLAGVSVAAMVTILAGVQAVRRGAITRHRNLMVTSFGLFGPFLTVDFYRLAVVGPTIFSGPGVIRTYLYLPLLVGHSVFALLTFPVVYYTLLLGLTRPVPAIPQTRHARIGRVAATLWLFTFGTGVIIYVFIHLLW